jgi:hypothetical protein
MRRVKHWRGGEMALRRAAAPLEAASKGSRRIMGYKDLWMLRAVLDEREGDERLPGQAAAG